jgi:hypothetical protein
MRMGETAAEDISSIAEGLTPPADPECHISRDEARELKRLAQSVFGYAAGEAKLRQDLSLEEGKPLTLMRISAHCTTAQYARLREAYEAALRREVEADVP